MLSLTAGSTDAIAFLGLSGLFTAHVTGNLVVLVAKFLAGDPARLAPLIAVPVFIAALLATKLFARGLEAAGVASRAPLLLLQFLLLAGFLAIAVSNGRRPDPNAPIMILAGMLGVSAMAVQNAFVRISLVGAPSTAVMTTNVTMFALDLGDMLLARDRLGAAQARTRAGRTGPAIVGFLLGCGVGAGCEAVYGLRALVVPVGLALLALALGVTANQERRAN